MLARTTGCWTAVLTIAFAGGAMAQQPRAVAASEGHSVIGTVADADGSLVEDAEIAVLRGDSATRSVRSDGNGRFRLDALPGDAANLRVRRLGFHERVVPVRLASDRPTTVFVKLDGAVAALGAVRIDEQGVESDGRLGEFYARERSNHFGHFIDEAQLAEMRPEHTSDALRAVPGVVVRPSGGIGNVVKIRGCSPLVWVDGLRAPGGELDDLTRGPNVAAIEIYNSQAGVPAQYTDRTATCGTILVWQKTY